MLSVSKKDKQTFEQSYQHVLKRFTALTFRNAPSKALFTHHLNVHQAADVLFQLDTALIQKNTKIINRYRIKLNSKEGRELLLRVSPRAHC